MILRRAQQTSRELKKTLDAKINQCQMNCIRAKKELIKQGWDANSIEIKLCKCMIPHADRLFPYHYILIVTEDDGEKVIVDPTLGHLNLAKEVRYFPFSPASRGYLGLLDETGEF